MMVHAMWNEVRIEALHAALVNHLWQSTAVAGIAWMLTLALRKNRARTRYWVWIVASVKFLEFLFRFSYVAGEGLRSLIATPIEKPVAVAMEQITQPFQQVHFFDTARMTVSAHRPFAIPALISRDLDLRGVVCRRRLGTRVVEILPTVVRKASPLAIAGYTCAAINLFDGARHRWDISACFDFAEGNCGSAYVRTIGCDCGTRDVPCAQPRQPDLRAAHDRRNTFLVLSAGVVDQHPIAR